MLLKCLIYVNFSIDSDARNVQVIFVEKPELKKQKHVYLIHI